MKKIFFVKENWDSVECEGFSLEKILNMVTDSEMALQVV